MVATSEARMKTSAGRAARVALFTPHVFRVLPSCDRVYGEGAPRFRRIREAHLVHDRRLWLRPLPLLSAGVRSPTAQHTHKYYLSAPSISTSNR